MDTRGQLASPQRASAADQPWTLMLRALVLLWLTAALIACHSPPPGVPTVSDVSLDGAHSVDRDEILSRLATARSPRFLGLWDGVVFEYEQYDPALLAKDLQRIRRYYVARGYYEARVSAARVIPTGEHGVRVQLAVEEGAPVITAGVELVDAYRLPISVATEALKSVELRAGKPFDEALYDDSKSAIQRTLHNSGFALAKVDGEVLVDLAAHSAQVKLKIVTGPPSVYGKVTISGLSSIPEDRVRATLGVKPGEPYSQSELEDARRALLKLSVFARVKIESDTASVNGGDPGPVHVPVTVTVEEGDLRTIRLSGGAELDTLRLGGHVTAGWEHRNFLGGLRKLTLEVTPGIVLYPTNATNFVAPSRVLLENRMRTELRQPAFVEGRTTGVLRGEFNVYPLLYATSQPDDPVLGYAEILASAGAERYFLQHVLRVNSSYTLQANFPFDYNALSIGSGPSPSQTNAIDVVVSYPELVTDVDLRDDPVNTHKGAFFRNTLQVAGFIFGGDTSDVKIRPEARFYVPISKTVTLATRTTFGLLFPDNYADTLQEEPTDANAQARAYDQQKLLFRALFSGGPNSNRGYPYRGVGPHGAFGFLSSGSVNCLDAASAELEQCQRPLGGLTLWEASMEVRFPLFGNLNGVTFLDSGDVTRGVAEFRGNAPHLSAGLGLRYNTPVGPFRVDAGYRLPGLQEVGVDNPEDEPEPLWDGGPPMTIYFGLGEAY